MRQLFNTLLTTAVILFSSCANSKKAAAPATPAASLYDTKWLLKKVYTESGTQDITTNAFIKFNQAKGSAGGNGSCNTFGSNAIINGNSVSFTNIFSTKMYCEGVQQTENIYLKQLGEVNGYTITGNSLQLLKDKKAVLEFVAE